MARLKYDKVAAVSEFLDCLGLVPRVLVTKEVVELIDRSWQRELQREDLERQKKEEAKAFIVKLSEIGKGRRKPKPILDNMIPLNFQSLYEDVSTAYIEEN